MKIDPDLVQQQMQVIAAREEANKQLAEIRAREAWMPLEIKSGTQRAAEAPTAYDYIIDPLWVRGHTSLVVGQYKKGKTTLLQNIVKSLATGEALFEQFPVGPITGSIVYLDLELTDNDLNLWIKKGGLGLDNVFFISMRGRSHHLDFRTEFIRRVMIEELAPLMPISVLFLDPVGAIAQTIFGSEGGENDNTSVGEFMRSFNRFLTEANIESAMISHHTGQAKGSARARGAAAWMDVPDAIWSYRKLTDVDPDMADAPDDARMVQITTRGAAVPEFVVGFDEDNRKLFYMGDKVEAPQAMLNKKSTDEQVAREVRRLQGDE